MNEILCIPGNYYYMTNWGDVENRTAVLTINDVKPSQAGIYSASYVGESPIFGAWMHLIIRGNVVIS